MTCGGGKWPNNGSSVTSSTCNRFISLSPSPKLGHVFATASLLPKLNSKRRVFTSRRPSRVPVVRRSASAERFDENVVVGDSARVHDLHGQWRTCGRGAGPWPAWIMCCFMCAVAMNLHLWRPCDDTDAPACPATPGVEFRMQKGFTRFASRYIPPSSFQPWLVTVRHTETKADATFKLLCGFIATLEVYQPLVHAWGPMKRKGYEKQQANNMTYYRATHHWFPCFIYVLMIILIFQNQYNANEHANMIRCYSPITYATDNDYIYFLLHRNIDKLYHAFIYYLFPNFFWYFTWRWLTNLCTVVSICVESTFDSGSRIRSVLIFQIKNQQSHASGLAQVLQGRKGSLHVSRRNPSENT